MQIFTLKLVYEMKLWNNASDRRNQISNKTHLEAIFFLNFMNENTRTRHFWLPFLSINQNHAISLVNRGQFKREARQLPSIRLSFITSTHCVIVFDVFTRNKSNQPMTRCNQFRKVITLTLYFMESEVQKTVIGSFYISLFLLFIFN